MNDVTIICSTPFPLLFQNISAIVVQHSNLYFRNGHLYFRLIHLIIEIVNIISDETYVFQKVSLNDSLNYCILDNNVTHNYNKVNNANN